MHIVNRRPNGTHYRRAKGDHLAALRWSGLRARISRWGWRREGVARPEAAPARSKFLSGFGLGQLRCLKRQLSLPVSIISQWWVVRSSSAVVILGSPNTVGHSPNARLVVMITEVFS